MKYRFIATRKQVKMGITIEVLFIYNFMYSNSVWFCREIVQYINARGINQGNSQKSKKKTTNFKFNAGEDVYYIIYFSNLYIYSTCIYVNFISQIHVLINKTCASCLYIGFETKVQSSLLQMKNLNQFNIFMYADLQL